METKQQLDEIIKAISTLQEVDCPVPEKLLKRKAELEKLVAGTTISTTQPVTIVR